MAAMTPQPGVGSFLVHQDPVEKGKQRGRGRTGRGTKATMDTQPGDADEAGDFQALLTKADTSSTPAENESLAPRTATTIDADHLLSRGAVALPPSLPHQHHPPPSAAQQTYTTTKSDPSMATTITATKVVPPHLRPKKSTPPIKLTDQNDSSTSDIREKLASVGAKVSDPKPAPKPTKAVSRPTPKTEATDQLMYKGRGCRPWGGARNSKWPTKKDFPKVDRKRWDTIWDPIDPAKTPSTDAARADGGWGTSQEQGNVDEAGYQLAEPWSGQWAPAPLDWDSRPAFRRDQSAGQIQQWLDCHENILAKHVSERERRLSIGSTTISGTTYAFIPNDEAVRSGAEQPMGDMCPSYWIPLALNRMAPQQFWNEILQSKPDPTDEEDLREARPYWQALPPGAHFFPIIEHPVFDGVSPDESDYEKLKRENDQGGIKHIENRRNFERAKAAAKTERHRLKAEKRAHITARVIKSAGSFQPEPPVKPGFKMYLRSAKATDIGAIRGIYNHYVSTTCAVPETLAQLDIEMLQQWNGIVARNLPFLVAMERGGVVKGRKKRNVGEDIVLPDKVIGFAFADEYNASSMYRFTASLNIFVHIDYYGKSVGSCLMDKMLGLLDPDHLERGGYNTEGEELEAIGPPARLIKSIIINFSHEDTTQGANRLEWIHRWLTTVGFKEHGFLPQIGNKLDHAVNMVVFYRKTGAVLDHADPPTA